MNNKTYMYVIIIANTPETIPHIVSFNTNATRLDRLSENLIVEPNTQIEESSKWKPLPQQEHRTTCFLQIKIMREKIGPHQL